MHHTFSDLHNIQNDSPKNSLCNIRTPVPNIYATFCGESVPQTARTMKNTGSTIESQKTLKDKKNEKQSKKSLKYEGKANLSTPKVIFTKSSLAISRNTSSSAKKAYATVSDDKIKIVEPEKWVPKLFGVKKKVKFIIEELIKKNNELQVENKEFKEEIARLHSIIEHHNVIV